MKQEPCLLDLPATVVESIINKFMESDPSVADISNLTLVCDLTRKLVFTGQFQRCLPMEKILDKLQRCDRGNLEFLYGLSSKGIDYATLLLGTHVFFVAGNKEGLHYMAQVTNNSSCEAQFVNNSAVAQAKYNYGIALLMCDREDEISINSGMEVLLSLLKEPDGRNKTIECRRRLKRMIGSANCSKVVETGCCHFQGPGHWNGYMTDIYGFRELFVNCDLCLIDVETTKLTFPMFDFEMGAPCHSDLSSDDGSFGSSLDYYGCVYFVSPFWAQYMQYLLHHGLIVRLYLSNDCPV